MLLTIEVIRHKIRHKIAKGFTLLQKGQNGSKLLKKVKTGFTLVELLVVLGILAVMLALVLIAINPLEMLNKTQDVAVQQVTKDFASATKYFYATEKTTPWEKNTSCRDELATKDTVSQMPSCVQELTKGGDLQTKAVNSDEAKDIFMTECSGSVALCYKPKSSTYRNDSNAKYGRNGALNPECPGGDNCYTCEFTTNEAQECFEIMSPNAEIASATFSDPEEPMPIVERPSISVCSDPQDGAASCMSDLVTDSKGTPLTTLATPNGLSPEQMHKAYNLPCTPGANTIDWQCDTPTIFGPKTVAVILAFHSPTIEADLAVYSQTFGLPPCTKANGCLTIVNQNGQTSPLPSGRDSTWAVEAAMDVQIAHAICQTCKILLVEAEDNYFTNLGAATSRAAQMGATVISNSYGNYEYPSYAQYESFYDHPGIAVTASSGDWGYGTIFPASHSKVIGVGGTELSLFPDNSYASEKTWNGAGSGCSATRLAGTYQTSLPNWSAVGCGTKKSVSDVSAVASPYTGAAIYDSGNGFGRSGWKIIGGTSLSSPLYAAVIALQGGIPSGTDGSAFPYTQQDKFRDVNIGSNGSCGGMLKCMAGVGYDGPTGLGTPNLLPSGEIVPTALPTNTPTPTPTPTPTSTPPPTPSSDQVWVQNSNNIFRLKSDGTHAAGTIEGRGDTMAVVGQEVWAAWAGTIYRYNFNATRTKSNLSIGTNIQVRNTLAVVGSQVWAVTRINQNQNGDAIFRFNFDGTSAGPNITGASLCSAKDLAVVGNQVWVTNYNGATDCTVQIVGSISRFNFDGTSAGPKLTGNGLNGPHGISVVGQEVWITNSLNHTISRFKPDGTSAGSVISGNKLRNPIFIEVVNDKVWVGNTGSGNNTYSISRFNFDGSAAGTVFDETASALTGQPQDLIVLPAQSIPTPTPTSTPSGGLTPAYIVNPTNKTITKVTSYTLNGQTPIVYCVTGETTTCSQMPTIAGSDAIGNCNLGNSVYAVFSKATCPESVSPSPTPTQTPSPTPSVVANCNTMQTVTLSQPLILATPGATLSNTLLIQNNNTPTCASTFYTISYGYPSGWGLTGVPPSFTLAAGATKSIPITISLPLSGLLAQDYSYQFWVAKQGQTVVENPANGIVRVTQASPTNPPTQSPTPTRTPTPSPTPTLYPTTPPINYDTIVPGYKIDQTKFFKNYAVFFFDYPGFAPSGSGWNMQISLKSDFSGDYTQQSNSFGIPSSYSQDAPLNPSYAALRQITNKYVGFVSLTTGYAFYENNCGQTVYWRITNWYNPSATDKKNGPTYTGIIDCTTKVGIVDPPLSWYSVFDMITYRQKAYSSSWDFDKNGVIDFLDYWLGAFSTKTRYGGWQLPE